MVAAAQFLAPTLRLLQCLLFCATNTWWPTKGHHCTPGKYLVHNQHCVLGKNLVRAITASCSYLSQCDHCTLQKYLTQNCRCALGNYPIQNHQYVPGKYLVRNHHSKPEKHLSQHHQCVLRRPHTTEEILEWKKWPSPEKSTPIGFPVSKGQPPKHAYR